MFGKNREINALIKAETKGLPLIIRLFAVPMTKIAIRMTGEYKTAKSIPKQTLGSHRPTTPMYNRDGSRSMTIQQAKEPVRMTASQANIYSGGRQQSGATQNPYARQTSSPAYRSIKDKTLLNKEFRAYGAYGAASARACVASRAATHRPTRPRI